MKKLTFIIAAVAIIAVNQQSFAQKTFAGNVKFETKFEGNTDPQKHKPSEQTYTVFENKVKFTNHNFGFPMHIIMDGDSGTITTLFDVPGQRMGYVSSREDVQEQFQNTKFSFKERGDSKNICGFDCKGYDITAITTDEDDEVTEITYIAYTTTEIGKNENINVFQHPGLLGYPLYVELESEGVKTITQAKEVKKGKVKAIDFLIPSDYKMLTTEELQMLMGDEEE